MGDEEKGILLEEIVQKRQVIYLSFLHKYLMENILDFEEYIQINEVKRNIPFNYLKKLMISLGYEYTNNEPNHKFSKDVKKKDGGTQRLTLVTHKHHTGGTVDAAAFTEMKMILIQEYELSGDKSIFDKVDWNFIGTTNPLKSGMVNVADDEDYSKYELVQQMFKNVWVMKNEDGEFNLCRSEEDKAPLLDRWYPLFQASKKLGGKMCLGYEYDDENDLENWGTYLYEIKEDGTLGETFKVDFVIESVKKS